MAHDPRERGGCGCCGMAGCVGALVLLIALGFLLFSAARLTWNLYSVASDQPLPAVRSAISPDGYSQARSKLNNFMGKADVRSVLLSEADVNALLADAPELAFLRKGVNAALRDNEAELRLRVPLQLVPFSTKYLNYEIFLRPIIAEGKVTVNVLRVTSGGQPLDPVSLRAFKDRVEPPLNQLLSGLNQVQLSRAVQNIRVQNGSVLLER
jgi:hypothetical protein